MLDMTIHDFYLARFVVGTDVPAVEVFCTASCMVDPAIGEAGDVDTAVVVIKFANGVVATIDNSRQAVCVTGPVLYRVRFHAPCGCGSLVFRLAHVQHASLCALHPQVRVRSTLGGVRVRRRGFRGQQQSHERSGQHRRACVRRRPYPPLLHGTLQRRVSRHRRRVCRRGTAPACHIGFGGYARESHRRHSPLSRQCCRSSTTHRSR